MYLPLFPLELVVFPGEKLKLHIFEPRYKQLICECRESGGTFGIPPFIEGKVAEYGTEVSLLNVFKTYDDGEMDILTEGQRAFRLKRFIREVPDKLYSGGEVTMLDNDADDSGVSIEELAKIYGQFHELLRTGYTRDRFDHQNVSFQLAQEVGLNLAQKVRLLSIPREGDRLQVLIDHLHQAIPVLEAAEETKKRLRGNGRFKQLPKLEL